MNRRIYLSFLLSAILSTTVFSQITLSGKVTDKTTNNILVGASVFIPDMQTGVATKKDGTYQIKNLPAGKFLVQVRYMGYASVMLLIDFTTDQTKDFALEPSSVQEQE
ncbi:MAG: carboxypeptidase-like regulatory domain-containing protein, partial [Bacteroidota bacterium]